jgi:hypothetical protein
MSFLEEKVLPQVLRVHDTVYRKTNEPVRNFV